jgi:hypothetical protein
MSPAQQRIKIAEACGWLVNNDGDTGISPINVEQGLTDRQICSWKLPDYLQDLNAMHEAWLTLPHYLRDRFEGQLYSIVIGQAEFNRNDDAPYITNATAAQRAEAFLKTLGLWEDDA